MNHSAIHKALFFACLIFSCISVIPNEARCSSNIEQSDSTKAQKILYVELLQPILFGKIGLGYGLKKYKQEYVFYASYIYGPGLIPEAPFNSASEYHWISREGSLQGFEFGTQIRFNLRTKLQKASIGKYIKNFSKKAIFYSGIWVEVAYKSGDPKGYQYDIASIDLWETKGGGLIGWSFDKKRYS